MSHIFDALLKSETERKGGNGGLQASVNDVLSQAEQRAAAERKHEQTERDGTGEANGREAAAISAAAAAMHTARGNEQGLSWAALPEHLRAAVAQTTDEESKIGPSNWRALDPGLNPNWKLVSYSDKSSVGAEAFRLLAVRLRHIRKDRQLKRLLITSTVPQEGKSLTSANLACALSAGGLQKVLLLEGDIHRPSITGSLGLSKEPGLCELLQGHSTLEQSGCRLEGPGFWILPAGQLPDGRLELIQSPKMPELLDQLNQMFDWIIIDSPPILPMADTSILARLADGIVLVTRRGVTEKKILERGLQSLETNKLVGAVVNSSRKRGRNYYYYYGGYGSGGTRRSRKTASLDPS